MAFLLALLLWQADDIPALVERLRSDSAEERTRAEASLKEIGGPAVPALKKAAAGSDADQAARARKILAVLEIREKLSVRLRTSRPGIDERLAVGAPRSWTKELLEILDGKPFPQGGLEWNDVTPLFSSALKGADGWREKGMLLDAVDGARLTELVVEAIPFLEDGDESVRRSAAGACGRTGGPDVFRGIARLLRRGTPQATESVREVLSSLRWDTQLPVYLDLLSKAEAVERIDLLALARQASPPLTEELLDRWRPDEAVRRALRPIYRSLNPDVAIPIVLGRDHCHEFEVEECAVKVLLLGDFDPAVSKEGVLAALGSENSSTRWLAAHLAAELGLKEAAAPLRRLLQDPDEPRARSAAAVALARLGLGEHAAAIAALLKDQDEYVRGDAAESLGHLGAKDQAASLLELLKDSSDYVREHAADAFAGLGAGQGDAIVRLLAAEDHETRRTAARALGRMGHRAALPAIAAALDDSDDHRTLLDVYARLGTRDDLRRIAAIPRPSSAATDLVEDAIWTIGRRDAAALPSIVELAADPSVETRLRAVRALVRLGAATASGRLVEALRDPDLDVRRHAAFGLGVFGAKDAAGPLEKLLEDPESYVRRAAAGSLCRLGVRRGVVPLLDVSRGRMPKLTPLNALRNPDEWQRWTGKRLDRDVGGPFRLVLSRLAARAGVKVDYSQIDESIPHNLWGYAQGGSTLIDALDHALEDTSAEVILEPGVVKLIPPKDADEFWRKWKDGR